MAFSAPAQRSVVSPLRAPNLTDSKLNACWQHPLFRLFDEREMRYLGHHIRRHTLNSHELVYHQDSDAQHFYFVVSGCVRLYRLDATGVDRTLDSHSAGECFAEVMIYADPARYACYAEALKNSEVLAIPVNVYREIASRNPDYTLNILRHYAGRAVSRFHDLEIMTVQSAKERVIRYLLDILPAGSTNNIEIELPLPKCLVASRLAMQPETFSRILKGLKALGLVKVSGGRVMILSRDKLALLCQ